MTSFRKLIISILILLSGFPLMVVSQGSMHHYTLSWKGIKEIDRGEMPVIKMPAFEGAAFTPLYHYLPLFHTSFTLPEGMNHAAASLKNAIYEPLPSDEFQSISPEIEIKDTVAIKQTIGIARGIASLDLVLVPLKKDSFGNVTRLKSFDLEINFTKENSLSLKQAAYKDNSVLASGKWYKIRVDKGGICKVSYEDLQSMGVDMSKVTPDHIRLFGKPGGMLPENNSVFRYDDLPENAISVVSANSASFAPGDYFLFYATPPDEIVFNTTSRKFEHSSNLYSDYTYYFLNFDEGGGKRIPQETQSAAAPKYTCNTFMDFAFHENDLYNLIKSGKQWIGERLDFNNPSLRLPAFEFANVETVKQAFVRYRLVARAATKSRFQIYINHDTITSRELLAYTADTFSQEAIETKAIHPVEGNQATTIKYFTPGSSDLGYIDWIELNVPRKMIFTGGQMLFADPVSVAAGNITRYNLVTGSPNVNIWDVSNPVSVKFVSPLFHSDTLSFTFPTDSIRRFVAWDNTTFNSVEFVGMVDNQNLHGIESADMLIVTHPDFLEQAERLANHHRTFDGLKVVVATTQQVYNEFSSGSPDISAVRDFTRMLYQRPAANDRLRFLLLMGDGSYDYKDHLSENTNYVLAFETIESQNLVFSTASDDFFGLLDENEGYDASGKLDIGIGRFPVDNAEQAKNMVDKCIFYSSGMPDNLGDWRNTLCFIADDEDNNTHIRQVEDQVTPRIESKHVLYNLDKIYLDAYAQVATPSGARYPDVNARINDEMRKGALIINYTGHGGETGWATESILTLSDINSWTNYTHMPVFMTATCEFSRFDDPGRVSAGEQVFLNPAGGGVALFTTTRLANAGNNVDLTMDLYDTIFSLVNGQFPHFGDVMAYSKNQNSSVGLIRNFMLLGDPAMHLAYPKFNVATTKINGLDICDTIQSMSKVDIEGEITDPANNNQLVQSFNGIVDIKVFDKFKWMMTRGNDPTSFKRYFNVQENILYQGKASVKAGKFRFSFIVPHDIDFSYGTGKISYYASNEYTDAAGYSDSIVIGGSSNGHVADNMGPAIRLYMNDERFVNGGVTTQNPMLLAFLSDSSGLNTVGNGIGHDLVATIDENSFNSIVLNDYYQADLDSYRSGKVTYNFSGLTEGPHTLHLKAWDVFNNSSEASIDFVVKKDLALQVVSVQAYPNPFTSGIQVEFEHNLFNTTIDAALEVYTMNGDLVRSIGPQSFYSDGYHGGKFTWDGRTASGARVEDGIYLLRVVASNGNSSAYKTVRAIKIITAK